MDPTPQEPRPRQSGLARRLMVDLTPFRGSSDLRALVIGQTASVVGSQLTAVAVPYQVYQLAHSSLDVGLVSLAVLGPLLAGSLLGGSVVDSVDRRRLLVGLELLMALISIGLAVNAWAGPALWPLFVGPALIGGLGTSEDAALSAVLPAVVHRTEVAAANALLQAVFQFGLVVGPAGAGLLLATAGPGAVFLIDAATFLVAAVATLLITPQKPASGSRPPGFRSIAEGLRFVRGREDLQGVFLIDLNATVFGLPRALFPALATGVFGGGATTLGLLYAAPGLGALAGALSSGWVGRIERQGRAVILAVLAWGLAITGFGLVRLLPAALLLLAIAGCADVVSAVLRGTIVQLSAPAVLRGRLAGLQIAVVTGGPRLGDLESGAVAGVVGATGSVVLGGVLCLAGTMALVQALPGFRQQKQDPAEARMAGYRTGSGRPVRRAPRRHRSSG